MDDGNPKETEVVYGAEATSKRILKVIQEANHRYDVIASSMGPTISIGLESLRIAKKSLSERGVPIRYLTDITKENLSFCKELASFAEVRHLDGIKGAFALTEREYIAAATLTENQHVPHLICSNIKEILEQQNYIFETMWAKGVPAIERFEEIELGKRPEFLHVIIDPKESVNTLLSLASSVEHEALVILPQGLAASQQQMLQGILDRLIEAAICKKAVVRIIGPPIAKEDPSYRYGLAEWLHFNINQAQTIRFRQGNDSNQMILIVDNRSFVRTELRTSGKAFYSSFEDSLGFTAYSNSQPAVASFRSLFEMVWKHLEVIEKLNAIARSREEFISVAAHELRSPITPILLMADLWKKGKAYDEASIKLVTRSAEKLDRLIRDVLEVTRVESHSLKLENEIIDLRKLTEELISDASGELEQEGKGEKVTLIFADPASNNNSKDEDPVLIEADKGRIVEVISNLISNAVKFTEEGRITASVEIRENLAFVVVRDEGKGIDLEIMPKLFTKYATKSHMGTGLGLYVSKNIIDAHGGKIWAENNKDGIGASFYFTLPLAKATTVSA